jgi:hypothetical protein
LLQKKISFWQGEEMKKSRGGGESKIIKKAKMVFLCSWFVKGTP